VRHRPGRGVACPGATADCVPGLRVAGPRASRSPACHLC
jgi:hypothetical protein